MADTDIPVFADTSGFLRRRSVLRSFRLWLGYQPNQREGADFRTNLISWPTFIQKVCPPIGTMPQQRPIGNGTRDILDF